MAVNLTEKTAEQLPDIDGIALYTAQAGVKKPGHTDLTLIAVAAGSTVGAVFTTNRFCAAPVHIAKSHLFDEDGVRALVINTGNANAGTGAQGRIDALAVCAAAARQIGCKPNQVLPFSTGVILEPLPADKIIAALPKMQPAFWNEAARAIMTTDTVPKAASREGKVGDQHTVRATGIAKGSGMIHPNMATMLGFIATDAKVSQPVLQLMTQEIADETFNTITVDGGTSTNDSFVIIATGKTAKAKSTTSPTRVTPNSKNCCAALRSNSPKPSSATARARPSSSPSASKTPKPATKPAKPPTPRHVRHWSKPPFSPPTPTSAGCSPPSVMPTLPTSIPTSWKCISTIFWLPNTADAPQATPKHKGRR